MRTGNSGGQRAAAATTEGALGAVALGLALLPGVAFAERVPVATLAHGCIACHGAATTDRDPSIPPLAGHDADVLLQLLRGYAEEDPAESTSMHRLTRGYSDQELAELARHFAEQEQ
ncbi:hypothetical protein M0534_13125 [Methylonatrum kenyense]|uniref:c-type cytochrome n=1 Tax=Methylonatrum kenyense TaxID=455253 RepID=UPI0020C00821|nr:hypothetical protein [Methylonatrum kenyense]MCK8517256.1 hypothetical protein [Methylonatrum kenyense]